MEQRSRVHRPAAHRRGHARWRLPMQPCNSSEFCCEDGPGCGAEEKGALWRPWRGNEQAGSEAHSERSRDGGGVSVPGPCGLRTATGGTTLGLDVGCSTGPPPARAPRPLCCCPLAQRHASARLLGGRGRTQGRQLLRLRAGVRIHHFFIGAQNRLHRLSISGTGCQRQGRDDHRPHDTHSPPAGGQDTSGWNDDLKARCLRGATRRPHGQVWLPPGCRNSRLKIMHKL